MQPAARISDSICHGGSITSASGDVTINSLPAARASDCACCGLHGSSAIAKGSGTVFINSLPAARIGDPTGCGASICSGSGDVLIGG